MGSLLGPTPADTLLAKTENGPLKKIVQKFTFYYRHVDDTFILRKDSTSPPVIIRNINEVHI